VYLFIFSVNIKNSFECMTALKHLCDHSVITNAVEPNELRGSFSSAASTSRSTKVNTCVLKSAPGLGVIGTRASFTESSSSERGAYIETQCSRYFRGTRHPQIASPHRIFVAPVFLHHRMLSKFDSCSIFPVAQSQGVPQMQHFH